MSKIFLAFWERQQEICRTIAKYRPNPSDVEELSQEVFLKAFAAEQTQEIQSPEHFLLTVAKNLAINAAKKKDAVYVDFIEGTQDKVVYTDMREDCLEGQLDARRKLVVVSQAVASLRPELAKVFMMRRVEGLKYKEIAEILGVSLSLVEKRMADALADCIIYLKRSGYDATDFDLYPNRKKRTTGQPMKVTGDAG